MTKIHSWSVDVLLHCFITKMISITLLLLPNLGLALSECKKCQS